MEWREMAALLGPQGNSYDFTSPSSLGLSLQFIKERKGARIFARDSDMHAGQQQQWSMIEVTLTQTQSKWQVLAPVCLNCSKLLCSRSFAFQCNFFSSHDL